MARFPFVYAAKPDINVLFSHVEDTVHLSEYSNVQPSKSVSESKRISF